MRTYDAKRKILELLPIAKHERLSRSEIAAYAGCNVKYVSYIALACGGQDRYQPYRDRREMKSAANPTGRRQGDDKVQSLAARAAELEAGKEHD